MKRLRIVSYAINGRGMGHLVRQLAILRQVRRLAAVLDLKLELWVLTSSEADTLARREGICALKMPSKAMVKDAGMDTTRFLRVARTWVLNAVAGLQPDLLIVDTFPGGSFGELVAALELAPRRCLVARRVKPEFEAQASYQALLPLYQRQVVPGEGAAGPILIRSYEELMPRAQARAALGIPEGARAVYVSMGGGGDQQAPELLPKLVRMLRADWHVVVGAGPLYSGQEIRGAGITWLDRYVPMELFLGLDAAVSAGGYNSFHELMHAGVPTVFLPQPRVADDQHLRVQQAVDAGAGRLAKDLSEIPGLLQEPGSGEAARALVPNNGAMQAALDCLSGLLPDHELKWAAKALPAGVRDEELDVARLLSGVQAAQERVIQGRPEQVAQRLVRWRTLVQASGAPAQEALSLLRSLGRKFPGAQAEHVLLACERLFGVWGPFDDWMGAISLLRAVPTQRGLGVAEFAERMAQWLQKEEDLFDALRDFTRLEGHGRKPVALVLTELCGLPCDSKPCDSKPCDSKPCDSKP